MALVEISGIVGYSEELLPNHRALLVDLLALDYRLRKRLEKFYSADGWEKILGGWEKTRIDIEQKYNLTCRFFYALKDKRVIGFNNSLESIIKIFKEYGIKNDEIFVMGLTYEKHNELVTQMI